MKKILYLIILFPLISFGQEINPNHFILTGNTGSNMTIMFTSLSEYGGGSVGAFYDLNQNGQIDEDYIYGSSVYTECVGIEPILENGQSGFALWGDDTSLNDKVGLSNGDTPQFVILFENEVILIDLGDQFPGYTNNGVSVINTISYVTNSENSAPQILGIPPTIEFVNGETFELSSIVDLWNDGVFYDADNTLEELTINFNVNEDDIILDWDGSSITNPILSAIPGFSGNTVIELCVSDFEATVCASNTIIVYETTISSQDEITADLFVAPLNTGSNMTVMISSSSFDSFSGSLIGAFKDIDSDGVMNCVGMYTIQEGNFGFPIWGDDTSTDEIDGIQDGDKVTFAILTEAEVKIISPYPLFNGFQANAIHIVNEYYTPISYSIDPGWNMVGYVGSLENNGIVEQMNGALNNGENMEETFQVIKNVSGQFWSSAFAQINTFTQGEGYMMYLTSEATSLNFQSPSAYQYGIEYPLSSGWNMVSFTGDVDADNGIVSSMDVALENGGTTEETFQVIKNVSGQFWSSAFAQIIAFTPGEAYMMYVIGQATTVNFQRE